MARTASINRSKSKSKAAVHAPEPVGTELLGVGLCLGALCLLAALFTLAPAGATGSWNNVIGSVGQSVAAALTAAMGMGAFVLPVFGLVWGVQCLRGQRPRVWGRKLALLPLFMALVAMEAALLLSRCPIPGLERSGPGGYFGLAMSRTLFDALGKASAIVLFFGGLAVLRFLTDTDPRVWVDKLAERWRSGEDADTAVLDEEYEEEYEDYDEAEEPEEEDDGDAADYGEDDGEWEYEDEEDYGEAEYEEEEYDDEEPEEGYDDEEAEDEEVAPPPVAKKPKRKSRRERIKSKKRAKAKKKKPPKQRGAYIHPPIDLLGEGRITDETIVQEEVAYRAEVLEKTLKAFRIEGKVVSSRRGPVITYYEVRVPAGVSGNQISKRADDIGRALKVGRVRVVTNTRGRDTIGIEVGNEQRDDVVLRDLIEESGTRVDRMEVPLLLGRDTAGNAIVEDLAKMPHCLIAGATGSGKSVCINAVLQSVLFTRGPDEVNLILVDPKQVELASYDGVPHLLTAVETDARRAGKLLQWAVERMEERYVLLKSTGVRNIKNFNELPLERKKVARERHGLDEESLPDKLPYIVIVVDEMADLMMTGGKDVELAITRLAQKSRAVGIHLILATQRPERAVITGLIKSNMPTRIAFTVSSKLDSRVVLDQNGAETLLGMGDMLYLSPRSMFPKRGQGALVTDEEVLNVVEFLKEQYPDVEYEDLLKQQAKSMEDPMKRDDLYNDATRLVLSKKLGSASMLQRCLGIGYTRASRLIEMMEEQGVVGPHQGSKARELYTTLEEWEADLEAGPSLDDDDEWDPDDPDAVDTSWD